MLRRYAFVVLLTTALPGFALAQAASTTTGSTGCATITQAAVDGAAARVQADDSAIQSPQSVTSLTCLDDFFSGTGLNVITSLLDPTALLNSIKGQLCNAVKSAWQSTMGSAQCGLTVSGFNLGFGGFGGGVMCPRLSFGGGGPTIGSITTGQYSGGQGLYVNGQATAPTGYTLPSQVP
ncbi:hypothetical protein ROTAS13_03198 [Roseomonas sp. TAS13]|uniref:hypothetical protein n=1 Tax=Roseomonas TaxID=125216 RepID=UPI000967C611|nr:MULTISPECIES: hypothetical protein [Roseomonas]MCG7351425.1 hypothetical protein [Roseomonas mucosa]MCG7358084.1 hypothetical protein [Roseomonas mucosa]GAV35521.1 hypothetical protein ROTAS13_03198 [Roseomonas sp. TAS13]